MYQVQHLKKHFKSIFFGSNWTAVNVKDTIAEITLSQAKKQLNDCNTIAALVFHINYYIEGILPVFIGGNLEIRDKFSYDAPNFETEKQWEDFKVKVLKSADDLYQEIAKLEEATIFKPFFDKKYGSYYSNIHGIIEHVHYHLGQIVILKKLV